MMKKNNNIQNTHGITPICTDAIGTDAIGTDAIGTDAIGRDAINRVSTTETAAPELRFHEFSDDWQWINGNDLFEPIVNKNHNSDLPILAITQEQGAVPRDLIDYKISVTDKSIESYKVVEIGDFIISLRSFQGGIEYSYYNGICSPAYIILRRKDENICNDFFRYYFKSVQYIKELNKNLEGIRDGKMISYKQFSEIKLPFPPLPEQRKIAACLSSLDELIKSVRTKIDLLKKHKKGLMQKMFPSGDGMANGTDNGATNGADNGTTNGASNDTPNGRDAINRVSTTATTTANAVPELRFPEFSGNWQMNKIKDICSIETGKSNTQDQSETGKYPFFIRSERPVKSNRYLFDCEAVITIGDGKIGKVFHYINGKFDLHQRCYKMADFKGVDGKYFFYFFSEHFYERAMKMSAKATVDSVRMEMISEMLIYFPSLAEQRKIAACLSSLDAEIQKYEQKLQMLEQHKKGLMQKMFVKL